MKIIKIRTAVVGSTGFIGSSVAKNLEIAGHETVLFNSKQPPLESNSLAQRFDEVQTVVWCASRVNPLLARKRPDLVALELTEWKSFLTALKKKQGVPNVIFLSSGGCTYSDLQIPFTERSEANGTNEYGRLKLQMEEELRASDVPFTILRASNVYGPRQAHGRGQGVIAEWKYLLNSNRNIEVFGSLDSFRDYIYIDDLCQGLSNVISQKFEQDILNLGSGIPTHLGEILNIFSSKVKRDSQIVLSESRPTDRIGYYLDISKIKHKFSWHPRTSIEDGLRATLTLDDLND